MPAGFMIYHLGIMNVCIKTVLIHLLDAEITKVVNQVVALEDKSEDHYSR